MAVVTIRDVPDDVKDALVRETRVRGQSLRAFLLSVLRRPAGFSRNGSSLPALNAIWLMVAVLVLLTRRTLWLSQTGGPESIGYRLRNAVRANPRGAACLYG